MIIGLEDHSGVWSEREKEVEEVAINYFQTSSLQLTLSLLTMLYMKFN